MMFFKIKLLTKYSFLVEKLFNNNMIFKSK